MKGKCLVIGAGFSKAIAKLPVTSEMISAFDGVFKKQCSIPNNSIRINKGKRLFYFINNLETKFLQDNGVNKNIKDKRSYSNFTESFEGLCSYIDLNLASGGHIYYDSDGKGKDLSGKSLYANYTLSSLQEIRTLIGDYLYLTLIEGKPNENLLKVFYDKFIKDCSSIVTFNYDLILEKFLYNKDEWMPKDGYGFTPIYLPEINSNYSDRTSRVKIFKMHGSLNWVPYSQNLNPSTKKNLQFEWKDLLNENYFFPDYLVEEENFKYIGGINSKGWIFPSWIQQFSFLEMLYTWNMAREKLDNADEVIFIGYSLPRADSAVCSLFTTIDWNKKEVKLFDLNAKELFKNYSFILRKSNIEVYEGRLEEYL